MNNDFNKYKINTTKMKESKSEKQEKHQSITRKQAIKKAGYSLLTAATLVFLSTKQSSAGS